MTTTKTSTPPANPHSPTGPSAQAGRPEQGQGDKRGLECRLECRYCGCRRFRVIYTRAAWGGRIIRRRECRHCGKRLTTWERSAWG